MFSFKEVLVKMRSTIDNITSEEEPIITKLNALDSDMTYRILSENIGTEEIMAMGGSLYNCNNVIRRLIVEYHKDLPVYNEKVKIISVRAFFTEGDYIDVSGVLLDRFKKLSLLYLSTIFKGEKYDSENYYYKIIDDISDRLIELDRVGLKHH